MRTSIRSRRKHRLAKPIAVGALLLLPNLATSQEAHAQDVAGVASEAFSDSRAIIEELLTQEFADAATARLACTHPVLRRSYGTSLRRLHDRQWSALRTSLISDTATVTADFVRWLVGRKPHESNTFAAYLRVRAVDDESTSALKTACDTFMTDVSNDDHRQEVLAAVDSLPENPGCASRPEPDDLQCSVEAGMNGRTREAHAYLVSWFMKKHDSGLNDERLQTVVEGVLNPRKEPFVERVENASRLLEGTSLSNLDLRTCAGKPSGWNKWCVLLEKSPRVRVNLFAKAQGTPSVPASTVASTVVALGSALSLPESCGADMTASLVLDVNDAEGPQLASVSVPCRTNKPDLVALQAEWNSLTEQAKKVSTALDLVRGAGVGGELGPRVGEIRALGRFFKSARRLQLFSNDESVSYARLLEIVPEEFPAESRGSWGPVLRWASMASRQRFGDLAAEVLLDTIDPVEKIACEEVVPANSNSAGRNVDVLLHADGSMLVSETNGRKVVRLARNEIVSQSLSDDKRTLTVTHKGGSFTVKLKEDAAGRQWTTKPGVFPLDPVQRRLVTSFVSYVLEDQRDVRVATREGFRAAAVEYLRSFGKTGLRGSNLRTNEGKVPAGGRFGLHWVRSASLRQSWSPGYLDENRESSPRFSVSATLLAAHLQLNSPTAPTYIGLDGSLVDVLAPLNEIVFRSTKLNYDSDELIIADVIRPRLDLVFGLPVLTDRLSISTGLSVRTIAATPDAGTTADSTYRVIFDAPKGRWSSYAEFNVGAHYVF